jgi:hypothetical protein
VCKWGDVVAVRLKVAKHLSHSGKVYWKDVGIDRCIATIVRALQEGGVDMLGSCCGHGQYEGTIVLADGRILRIQEAGDEWEETERTGNGTQTLVCATSR